jgi:hypothetical protein
MIARSWHGVVSREKADACHAYLGRSGRGRKWAQGKGHYTRFVKSVFECTVPVYRGGLSGQAAVRWRPEGGALTRILVTW